MYACAAHEWAWLSIGGVYVFVQGRAGMGQTSCGDGMGWGEKGPTRRRGALLHSIRVRRGPGPCLACGRTDSGDMFDAVVLQARGRPASIH
jgi:hypothetical protein